ncbi:DUF6489 family protein [Cobetia crustatorum]|uniref:DUF6489 family protein n=1 Tax=Cobetia crustatorum TaxID=553385 RepID=UPI000469F415|nr:DUF6489 family protein [Cobetia crustatorum]
MKINVEFDLTPQEFRQAMGLPDVEAFQQELMERFRRQMEAGVEGYDPMSLLKPLMTPGAGTPFAKFMPPGMAEGMMGGASGSANAGQGAAGGMSGDMGESMAQGMAAFNQYQKMMLETLQQFGQQSAEADSDGQQKATAKTVDAKRDAAADKPDSGASASARSRSKKS